MKTVVLVAPHFIPSFLAGVHRARLLAYHLPEFGWKPIILTTDPAYYECQVDWELQDLLPDDLKVITARAFPIKPLRLVGDIGLRSLPWYYREVRKLAERESIDFLHITIPSNMAALLGPRVERHLGIPYGIDYIDPWVPEGPTNDRFLSKAWIMNELSHVLEPIAVRRARLITGINEAYFSSVLSRNPHLKHRVVTAGMPYGGSSRDFDALRRRPRSTFLFDPDDGNIHLIYAGALLPKAVDVVKRFLESLSLMRERFPESAKRLRVHFVGTGIYENDPNQGHGIQPLIKRYRLEEMVSETPNRIKYLDVLNHLERSAGILVIGSTEPHYSPSKIYQGLMARRPVFALLHEQSTAIETLRSNDAVEIVSFKPESLPEPSSLCDALEQFLVRTMNFHSEFVEEPLTMSSRESSRILAEAMDRALNSVARNS